MQDFYQEPEERTSFLGSLLGGMWTAIKWIAAAALVISGIALASRSAANWIDRQTGTEGNGWGSAIRGLFGLPTGAVPAPEPTAGERIRNPENHGLVVGAAAVTPVALASTRAIAPGVKAAAEAAELTAAKVTGMVPEGAGATLGAKVKQAARVVTEPAKDAWNLVRLWKPITETAPTAAAAATYAASAAAAAGDAIPVAGKALSYAKIGAEFAGKAGPALKVGGRLAGPAGAVVGGYLDAHNAVTLYNKGEKGSAIAQGVGGAAESIGMFGSIPGMVIGSVIKEATASVDGLLLSSDGKTQMTRSAMGDLIDYVPGVVQTQDAVATVMGAYGNRVMGANQSAILSEQEKTFAKRTQERIDQLDDQQKTQYQAVRDLLAASDVAKQKHVNLDYMALSAVKSGEMPIAYTKLHGEPTSGLAAGLGKKPADKGKDGEPQKS